MALIATDQGCKLNGASGIYGRVGPRKEVLQGKAESCSAGQMQPKDTEYSTNGLPKAFLHSLRTLFDILDDSGRGYVHISEIETRWQGADTRDLPGGVGVPPPHGCLTFERFVAGLRYSMLNPENSTHFNAQAAVHPQQTQKQPQKPTLPSACSVGTRAENKVRPLGPSDADLAHCCPDGSEPGQARGPSRSRGIARPARPSLDSCLGCLKQMKELEQEKDSLLAGLELVEQAREWYQGQIHNVAERQRQVGQTSHCMDFFTDVSQSRMNVLIPKLQEVNRCLSDLISSTGMSFPSSSAQPAVLSTNFQPPAPAPPQAFQRLKDQNRLLTQEVTEKSERIAQLEQEKSALIKQLFEARAHCVQDTSTMDSTFI
uniref:Suppressor APC domain-containing protein n=1 Tax=Monopterus albus TaxID=43700 RepID=A0A3Q3RCR0_MONAL